MASPFPLRDPTPKQKRFAEAYVSGMSLTEAFCFAYPAVRGPRSRNSERVRASRLAKNPVVRWCMEQAARLQADLRLVQDPEQVRINCLVTLERIRDGRMDPGATRATIAALNEANRVIRERQEAVAAEREAADRDRQRQLEQAQWQKFLLASAAIRAAAKATAKTNTLESQPHRPPGRSARCPRADQGSIPPALPRKPALPRAEMQEPNPTAEQHQSGLRHLLREQKQDRAALQDQANGQHLAPPPPESPPPTPSGRWELTNVPGTFPPRRRRVWIANPPQQG